MKVRLGLNDVPTGFFDLFDPPGMELLPKPPLYQLPRLYFSEMEPTNGRTLLEPLPCQGKRYGHGVSGLFGR